VAHKKNKREEMPGASTDFIGNQVMASDFPIMDIISLQGNLAIVLLLNLFNTLVDNWRGARKAGPFPAPPIKPCVPISGTRLNDDLHCVACTG
jgi:hypothetical protein